MLTWLTKNIGLIAAFWLFVSLFSSSFASPVVIDVDNNQPIALGSHYQVYVDAEHTTTIMDILLPRENIEFTPLPEGKFNLGYRPETHWFKLHVRNNHSQTVEQLLEFDFPLLDELSVYLVHSLSRRILAQYDVGDTLPFNDRYYQYPNFVLPVSLPAKTELVFYFRIKSKGSITAGATLWQPDTFPEQSRTHYFFIALYLGLLVGLISYNFLLFISIYERSYLYYVLLACSILLAVGSYSGLWFEFLWPNSPRWHNLSVPISFSLAGIFAALFSRKFLRLHIETPRLDKVFRFLISAFVLTIIASPLISLFYIVQILSILALTLAITALTTGLILSLEGNRTALTYLISWIFFVAGALILLSRNFGFIPNTIFTQYAIFIGSALEMILLAFALVQHINQVKADSQQLIATNIQLREQKESLNHLAHYDALTGLANRTLIMSQLDLSLAQCKRRKTKLAILFIDLDNFKPINDQYGHDTGDEVLIEVANRLRSALRKSDTIGRLGGDEFVILVESSHGEFKPQHVANKIKRAMKPMAVFNDIEIQLGVSIGISIYPDESVKAETLMAYADTAMYVDKAYRRS